MSVALGSVSPTCLLASSCAFMVWQPRRSVKVWVRAMLTAGAWLLSGGGPANLESEETTVAWADFTPLPDLSCQCPVLSSNLSSASPWAMVPLDNSSWRTMPLEAGFGGQLLGMATKPETIVCVVLAAFMKATHDIYR